MADWIFKIDGNYFPVPSGWDSLSLTRNFDGRTISTTMGGSLTLTDDLCTTVKLLLEENPCKISEVEILFLCPPGPKETLLHKASLKLADAIEDCTSGHLQLSVQDFTTLNKIEAGKQVCIDGTLDVELFQYESGGTLTDLGGDPITTKAIPVYQLLTGIVDFFGDGTGNVVSSLFGPGAPTYLDHVYRVDMPAFSPGDVILIEIETEFGTDISASVTVPGGGLTTAQLAERMRNALLYIPFARLSTTNAISGNEVVHRLSNVTASATYITITSDYEITDISISVNGTPDAGLITEVQPYRYSMRNLLISAQGLNPDGQICTTWSALTDALYGIFNTVIEDQGDDIRIDRYSDVFTSPTPTSNEIEDRRTRLSYDQEWMKKRLEVGYNFELENRQGSLDTWEWVLTEEVFSGDPFGTTNTVTRAGRAKIAGNVCLDNIGGTDEDVALDVYIDTGSGFTKVGDGALLTVFAGGTSCFDIDNLLNQNNPQLNNFCFDIGDRVQVQYANSPSANIQLSAYQPDPFRLEYFQLCLSAPATNENVLLAGSGYNNMTGFQNCTGVKDVGIAGNFYGGLGFAISQVAMGLASYEESLFLMCSDNATDPKQFQRKFYIADEAAVCDDCYKDTEYTAYYYNMLLQKPHILRNFQSVVPSNIQASAYTITNSVDASGIYSASITNKTANLIRMQSRIKVAEIDIKQSPQDFLTRKEENTVLLTACDYFQESGQIVNMEMNIKKGTGSIKLLV